MRQRTPEMVRETSAEPRLKKLRPTIVAQQLPCRLHERRAGDGLTDRGELAADACDRRGVRFEMQIARAQLAAFSNPLLNRHGRRIADQERLGH